MESVVEDGQVCNEALPGTVGLKEREEESEREETREEEEVVRSAESSEGPQWEDHTQLYRPVHRGRT